MAFVKKHFFNFIFVCLFGTVLFKQTPILLNSYNKKGTDFPIIRAINLEKERLNLPFSDQKAVYVFWATWCSPCHLQLKLFQNAVNNNKLTKDDIIAVNLGEDFLKVKDFVKQKKYPFQNVIVQSKNSWSKLGVVATPSIAYVNERGKIKKFSAGLSPLAVYKASSFLERKLQ